ncbi:MAG: hypothetical protein IT460_14430 [Planctomycetes bacterium]|nr:hypothetical protein [Planctomycetota bacterium]
MDLCALWLPILVSAVAVWIVSAICWMVLPHHAKDQGKLPDEPGLTAVLKAGRVAPGAYAFPYATRKECKDPEFTKRWMEGPTGWLVVMGPMRMGRSMLQTFGVYLAVSVIVGYLAATTLSAAAGAGHVFRVTGTAGVLAYSFAFLPNAIWFGRSRTYMLNHVLDGVLMGLATGGTFALLW